MQLIDFLKLKGMKQSHLANTLNQDKSNFHKRVCNDRLLLSELRVLRNKNILTLEDIDILTK